jgi:hypothetical protein
LLSPPSSQWKNRFSNIFLHSLCSIFLWFIYYFDVICCYYACVCQIFAKICCEIVFISCI